MSKSAPDPVSPSGSDGMQSRLTRRSLLEGALKVGLSAGLIGTAATFASCGGSSASAPSEDAVTGATTGSAPAKRGGVLRIAFAFDSASATLDPHKQFVGYPDGCRCNNIFDMLTDLAPDGTVEMRLAESVEPASDGRSYTIRLRSGVTFHDGKPLTADDVIYSFKRTVDPETGASFATQFQSVDIARIKKVDPLTVEVPLNRPNTDLIGNFFLLNIVQDGATDFSKPVGTGPFMYKSFTPGREFRFVANPNYWLTNQPIVDELYGVVIPDEEARLNALLAKDVDAIESVALARAKSLMGDDSLSVRSLQCNTCLPFAMAVDLAPFQDVRVRQALRLIADRQQLVDSALAGFGTVSNDLYGLGQPLYNGDLPQRQHDPEQAKALLQQAGVSSLAVTLSTSTIQAGMLEASTIFAEQARAAGIDVKLEKIPSDSFYGDRYLHYPFSCTAWGSWPIPLIYEQTLWSKGPWPETHWNSPEWDKMFLEAQGATDMETKRSLYFDLQSQVYDDGGYLYWGDSQWVEGYAPNLAGISDRTYYPLGSYDFRQTHFTT